MVRLLVTQAYADTFGEALGSSPGKRLLKTVARARDPVLFFGFHVQKEGAVGGCSADERRAAQRGNRATDFSAAGA
ncbi:hypothetical protein [Burkholderia stabilis]|uniref:hypothetical protein n=1 Tax=Burkholderia stabilis TaxID=95485 RepID=UPI000EFAB020|nr:hypothetical protein [Burkholderia stabilis]